MMISVLVGVTRTEIIIMATRTQNVLGEKGRRDGPLLGRETCAGHSGSPKETNEAEEKTEN